MPRPSPRPAASSTTRTSGGGRLGSHARCRPEFTPRPGRGTRFPGLHERAHLHHRGAEFDRERVRDEHLSARLRGLRARSGARRCTPRPLPSGVRGSTTRSMGLPFEVAETVGRNAVAALVSGAEPGGAGAAASFGEHGGIPGRRMPHGGLGAARAPARRRHEQRVQRDRRPGGRDGLAGR